MKQFNEWYIDRCYADIYESMGMTPKQFRKMELRYINELRIKYNEGLYEEGIGSMLSFPFRMLWKAVKGVGLVTLIGGSMFLLTKYGMKSDAIRNLLPKGWGDFIDKAIAKVEEKGGEFAKAAWEKIKEYMPDFAGMLRKFICGLLSEPMKTTCLQDDEDRENIDQSLASSKKLQQKYKGKPSYTSEDDQWSPEDREKEIKNLNKREKAGYYNITGSDILDKMTEPETYGGGTYGKAMAGLGTGVKTGVDVADIGAQILMPPYGMYKWLYPRKRTAVSEKDPGGSYSNLIRK